METSSYNSSDLSPDQREAAEKLIGRPLVNFEKMVVRDVEEGSDIVIRFSLGPNGGSPTPGPSKWNVPNRFNVLTDLSETERKDFDAVVSEPVRLSKPA
jgi:hypothetical protein